MRHLPVALRLLAAHLAAIAVSIIAPVALAIIVFIALFVIAVVTDQGLGSPVALPLWLVIISATSTAYSLLILCPAVIIAEAVSGRLGAWRHIAQIPLALLSMTFILAVVLGLLNALTGTAIDLLVAASLLAVPLGLYWWVTKFIEATFAGTSMLARSLVRRLRPAH